eukprot:scaffold7571_cov449-Pinguiococcus_pyrenoidosus.AAC.1
MDGSLGHLRSASLEEHDPLRMLETCQAFLESAIGSLGTCIDDTAQRLQQQYQENLETLKGIQSIVEEK